MKKIRFIALLSVVCLTTPVMGQSAPTQDGNTVMLGQATSGPVSVSRIYKQPIHTPQDERIGEVEDILLSTDGQATALIVGVGGFLGTGETHVAVPYKSVSLTTRGDRPRVVMDTTREQLKSVATFRYDRDKMVWVANEHKKP
jgi:sporulation protein YlmC with PRC-barrel domain